MRVRMKVGRYDGEVRVVPPHVAETLIADGRAERIDDSELPGQGTVVETTSVGAPETAATRTGRLQPRLLAAPKPIGGGWYELPDGTRVRGKKAAQEAMEE